MPSPTPEYLTLREAVAEYPGLLCQNIMRFLIHRGSHGLDKLVTYAGRSVRIRRDRLERFVNKQRHAFS